MLEVSNLAVSYGDIPAIKNVSLKVNKGDVVSVLGPNGAGKTTLLKTISGLLRVGEGSKITFLGERIDNLPPDEIVARGIIHLPEGRKIFPDLTVMENVEVGSIGRKNRQMVKQEIEELFEIFPELKGREKQLGGTLSGGEQQMLATARALIAAPTLLMIDEPSMGLAPVIVKRMFKVIRDVISKKGITVLLVEQNAFLSMEVSNRAYILAQGEIRLHGTVEELRKDPRVKETYLRGVKKGN